MKLASEIKNLDIFSIEDNTVLGKVKDLVIDPANGKVVAFRIYGKGIKKDQNLISALEVKRLDQEVLVIESKSKIETEKELPKPYEILKSKIRILKNKVFTESGNFIGKVSDFAFDPNTASLSRIYVKGGGLSFFLGADRVFSFSQVIEITKDKIVVFDKALNMEKATVPEISA